MWSDFVNLRTTVTAAVIGTLGVFATPQHASAQTPDGSYTRTCRNSYMSRDGVLHAECRNGLANWQSTTIRPADCRNQDIANRNGQLVCVARRTDDRVDNDRSRDDGPNGRGHGYGHVKGRGKGHDKGHGKGRDGWDNNRRGRRNDGVTLFTGKRYSGQTMYISQDYSNLGSTGFNDVASSIRIDGNGTWRLCTNKNYSGRCIDVTSSTSDLARIGLGDNISSIRRIQ